MCILLDSSIYCVILFVLLSLSAFFSASETAFSSVNLIRLRQYAESGRPGAQKALYVAERFDEVLLAILIGNNIVNLTSASLATMWVSDVLQLGASSVALATAAITVVIIIFGEILPKSYAKEKAEILALRVGRLYYCLIKLFKPLIALFMFLKEVVAKLYRTSEAEPSVTEDELNVIIDTMEEEGVLQQDEVEMLQSVLDLSDTFVKNIMTPRVDIVSVSLEDSIPKLQQVFLEEKYSRIPVYQDSRDHIVGVIYQRDLFSALIEHPSLETLNLSDFIHEPVYVSGTMRVSDLLARLQGEKQHLAIVVDEFGGTAGLVTLEDVLEELVGEIYDEHDEVEEEPLFVQKGEMVFEVKAEMALEALFDLVAPNLTASTEHHSLGSWLYSKIEDIPCVGDLYQYQGLLFTVTEVEGRRIKYVQVEAGINPPSNETSA